MRESGYPLGSALRFLVLNLGAVVGTTLAFASAAGAIFTLSPQPAAGLLYRGAGERVPRAHPRHLCSLDRRRGRQRGRLTSGAVAVQNGKACACSREVTHCQEVNSSQLDCEPNRLPLPEAPVPPNGA